MDDFKRICSKLSRSYVTIVALGDSNTEVNHWTLGALNYVGLIQCNLWQIFGAKGFSIINSGVGGDDIFRATARLERDLLRFKPELAIVSLGLNDSRSPDVAAFKKAYGKLLVNLRKNNVEILTRTPNPPVNMIDGSEMRTFLENGAEVVFHTSEYSEAIRELSSKHGVCCVDHYSLWSKSLRAACHGEMTMLMGNYLHPNGNGHRRFYHELAPVLGLSEHFQFDFRNLIAGQREK